MSQVLKLDSLSARTPLIEVSGSDLELLRLHTPESDSSRRWKMILLGSLIGVIFAVSIYDVYWSFKTQDVMQYTEQNPIGAWLIFLDGGDIALFMTCKMIGTMVVILAVPFVYRCRKSWGLTCGFVLAFGQVIVFCYLTWGHYLAG